MVIGTGPPPGASSYTAAFGTTGPDPSLAVGQTFIVPTGAARLDAVQFWVRNDPGVLPPNDFRLLTYRLYVAPFDPASRRVSGAPVFVSASRAGFADTTLTAVGFATGGTAVRPGARYLAFFVPDEPTGPFPLTPHHGLAGGFPNDVYADGQAYTLAYDLYQVPPQPGPLDAAWTAVGGDFAFSATFTAVPEPATSALVALGCVATAVVRRTRRDGRARV